MVADVCWNPAQGADVLGQERVVLIKAPCPAVLPVPTEDLAPSRGHVFQGGDSGVGFPRDRNQ